MFYRQAPEANEMTTFRENTTLTDSQDFPRQIISEGKLFSVTGFFFT